MLRCSNVTTLQTGVGRAMAIRIAGNSRIGRPAALFALAQRIPLQIENLRRFSWFPGLADVAPSTADGHEKRGDPFPAPRRKRIGVFQGRGERRDSGEKRRSQLLEIAIEGTNPHLREKNRRELEKRGKSMAALEGAVKKELHWLSEKDPAAFAERVQQVLRRRDARFAAELVRKAQSWRMDTTVAWNYLLAFCVKADEPEAALKFYNEMRKRGGRPNSATYTTLLSGLGRTDRDWWFKSKAKDTQSALSIYNSMFDPKNEVRPTIDHANALLAACIRQGDFDTLWSVAADLPQEGFLAPDTKTYTHILKAIRISLETDVQGIPFEEVDRILERRQRALIDGKKVWSEVSYLWKRGRVQMDNYLANNMARLLLNSSTDRDYFDLFRLYNQVSGIPIFAKEPPGETMRRREDPKAKRLREERARDPDTEFIPWTKEKQGLYRPPPKEEDEPRAHTDELEIYLDNAFDPVVSENAAVEEPPPTEMAASTEETVSVEETTSTEQVDETGSSEETAQSEKPAPSEGPGPVDDTASTEQAEQAEETGSAEETKETTTTEQATPVAENTSNEQVEEAGSTKEATPAEEITSNEQVQEASPVEGVASTQENTSAQDGADPIINTQATRKYGSPRYISFGNVELSNILEGCQFMTQDAGAARGYWSYMTLEDNRHKIQPDQGACHNYLRILRKHHSSRQTLQLLRDQMVPAGLTNATTFHIAMSCCERDRLNPNILQNAKEIMQLMEENRVLPDPRALVTYLDMIQNFERNPQRLGNMLGLDTVALAKKPRSSLHHQGREMIAKLQLIAVATLHPHVSKLHETMQQAHGSSHRQKRSIKTNDDGGVTGGFALKVMVRTRGLMDNLLQVENGKLILEEDKKLLKERSHGLAVYSGFEAPQKFRDNILYPTKQQAEAFVLRRRAATKGPGEEAKEAEEKSGENEDRE